MARQIKQLDELMDGALTERFNWEMEKVLSRFPKSQAGEMAKSDQVLNINSQHPVFAALKQAHGSGDEEKLKEYAAILYDQARLIEGLPLDDPAAFARRVAKLMV